MLIVLRLLSCRAVQRMLHAISSELINAAEYPLSGSMSRELHTWVDTIKRDMTIYDEDISSAVQSNGEDTSEAVRLDRQLRREAVQAFKRTNQVRPASYYDPFLLYLLFGWCHASMRAGIS